MTHGDFITRFNEGQMELYRGGKLLASVPVPLKVGDTVGLETTGDELPRLSVNGARIPWAVIYTEPRLSANYKANLECVICSRQWEAIYPVDHQTAPCPDCGYENVVPTAKVDP